MVFRSLFESALRRFRARRMDWFLQKLAVREDTRVLDVGGTAFNWSLAPVRPRLTLLNMARARPEAAGEAELVIGDGRYLPFADGAFDVVFSNSVIEHVGTAEEQRKFAAEAMRVGKQYWVQTPHRWFPVEAHLLTPLLHYLPRRWQAWWVNRFTVWEWISHPTPDQREFYLQHYLNDVRLLDAGALRKLFPDALILRERFFGLTKSLIAVRRR